MANILNETFTGTNGTLMSAHRADSGQSWIVDEALNQTAQLSGGQCTLPVGAVYSESHCQVNCNSVPSTVQVDCLKPTNANTGFSLDFRLSGDRSQLIQFIVNGGGSTIDCYWQKSGAAGDNGYLFTGYVPTWSGGATKDTLKLAVSGSQIRAYFKGVDIGGGVPGSLLASNQSVGFLIESDPAGAANFIDNLIATVPMSMGSSTIQVPTSLTAATLSSGITFAAKDSSGKTLSAGGDIFTATITGTNAGSTTSIADNGDGTYGIFYTPPRRGADAPSANTSGTTISGATIPVNPPAAPSLPAPWSNPGGPSTGSGGLAFSAPSDGGSAKLYGGVNGGPAADDRYSKLGPVNDGAGDVNFLWRVDDIAPIVVSDTQPVSVINMPGALNP